MNARQTLAKQFPEPSARRTATGTRGVPLAHLEAVLATEEAAQVSALDRVLVLGGGPIARAVVALARYWGAEVVTRPAAGQSFDAVIRTRPAALPAASLRPSARVVDLGSAATSFDPLLPEAALDLGVSRKVVRIDAYAENDPQALRRARERVEVLRTMRVLPALLAALPDRTPPANPRPLTDRLEALATPSRPSNRTSLRDAYPSPDDQLLGAA